MKQSFYLVVILLCYHIGCVGQSHEIFEFKYQGHTLNGVLNKPQDSVPKGLVLIIHGSGRTNAVAQNLHGDVRYELVKSGYAVYMWDKMGCGKSEGTFDYNQSVQSSADEAITAIKTLQQEHIPGSDSIGLWGISRAGWICPLIIKDYETIKFWISVSGVDAKENFNYLLRENLEIKGHPKDSIHLLMNEFEKGNRITHAGGTFEAYMEATQNIRENKFLLRFNNHWKITEEAYYTYQKTFMNETFDETDALMVYIDNFEALLSSVNCPVLALFGEKDKNVDWEKTKRLYEQTLGKHTALVVRSFPDANHNLFQCKTGGFYEFQDDKLPWHRAEGFLETMSDWLAEL